MSATAPWFSLPKSPTSALSSFTVLIIGAGLGGAWLARTLAERGISSTVLDSNDIGSGASGSAVGVVKPYVTRAPGFIDYFYYKAYDYLLRRLNDWQLNERCGFTPCGVLQLCHEPFPKRETYRTLTPAEASARAGVTILSHGLWFDDGGYLDPHSLCHALLEHPLITVVANSEVLHIDTSDQSAYIEISDRQRLQADAVVLATGSALTTFPATQHLGIVPARGQTSDFRFPASGDVPLCVVSSKRYVVPGKDSLSTGATFLRDDCSTELRDDEHRMNYQGLCELLPGLELDATPIHGYAGVRATTPDRLPLVGPVPDHAATADAYRGLHHGRPQQHYPTLPTIPRLMVLGGFGSRGIVTSAYSAHLLADYLFDMDTASDSLTYFSSLISPVRFQIRELKRRQ